MSDLNQPGIDVHAPETRGLGWAVLAFTGLAMAVFVIVVTLFARTGGDFVGTLDEGLGEVLMRRGMRFEAAGELENAKEAYHQAVERPFTGPQNRADTLKRLGVIYWAEGRLDAAYPYLRKAADFNPPPISVFEPLCDCLLGLHRHSEARTMLDRWLTLARATENTLEIARAKYCEGRLARVEGDTEAALRAFLEGAALVPGGRNASELGMLYFEMGEYEKALEQVDYYLESGTGDRAEYMRRLRGHLLKLLGKGS